MTFFPFTCKFESFFKSNKDVALQHNGLLHLKKSSVSLCSFGHPSLFWTMCLFFVSHFYDSSSLLALNIFSIISIGVIFSMFSVAGV